MTQETKSFRIGGGLDLVTPAIQKDPGIAIGGVNHEPTTQGLRRIDGYERLDGRPSPSDASYSVLNFDAGTATIAEGATVTGATSGATGKTMIAMVVSSGAFGTSNAAGYLVLTTLSGTFQDNENLQVGGVTKCVANGVAVDHGASNDTDDTTWIRDAIETARALIGTVTGSGAIRGVWTYGGTKYAFRDNAGGTACVMFKSTVSGWTAVSLGSRVSFTTGTGEITAGQTVTGATSGATGVVTRVATRTGTWGTDAAGQLIFASITGTFSNGENLQVGGVTKAVANGASAAVTLPAGGRYEFVNHNFFGASDLRRMYGVNGVGTAFEFDGTVFVPVVTGMTTDTPNHIRVKSNHLFLSFPGGSVQNSSIGNPYGWSAVTGAAEIGIGDDVAGFADASGDTLAVIARNKCGLLYGTSSADFQMETMPGEAGGMEWTVQSLTYPVMYDNQGIRNLAAVQTYGDFEAATMSRLIKPLIDLKRKSGVTPTASLKVKNKNQYRVFFSDGTGLVMDVSGKRPEFMSLNYGLTVRCCSSSEDSSGDEILLFGSDNGYVYQLDKGTSFDGAAVDAWFRLAFFHLGSPTQNKRLHKAGLEVTGEVSTSLQINASFSYGNPDLVSVESENFTISGGGGFWDDATWDQFLWDSEIEGTAEAHIDGFGKNVSFTVASLLTYEEPYTAHGMTIHFTPAGLAA